MSPDHHYRDGPYRRNHRVSVSCRPTQPSIQWKRQVDEPAQPFGAVLGTAGGSRSPASASTSTGTARTFSDVMSTIRSHRAELPGTPRMPLAVLALASTALLAWCGVIASGPSPDRPAARFHTASGGSPVPSAPAPPTPDPPLAGAVPAGEQVAGAVGPASGATRPARVAPPPGGATTSSDGEARPGRPCRPDGATAQGRNGRLRCTARPGSKEPRWRKNG